jgi:hypothetical protein
VFGEPEPDPGVAEKPPEYPPENRGENGLPAEPKGSVGTTPGSKLAGESPLVVLTFDAGCEPPWSPTAARMARKAATLAPPTNSRVRLLAAARRAPAGALPGAAPAGAADGSSKCGYQGLGVVDGGVGAVGRGATGTAVDDGSIAGPDGRVGGVGGSSKVLSAMALLLAACPPASTPRLDGVSEEAGRKLGLCGPSVVTVQLQSPASRRATSAWAAAGQAQ